MFINNMYFCRQTDQMNGALINGLEARVNMIEDKLEDIDARTSEEADNALNEREMDRFIMSGRFWINVNQGWARSIGEASPISTENRDRDFFFIPMHRDYRDRGPRISPTGRDEENFFRDSSRQHETSREKSRSRGMSR